MGQPYSDPVVETGFVKKNCEYQIKEARETTFYLQIEDFKAVSKFR